MYIPKEPKKIDPYLGSQLRKALEARNKKAEDLAKILRVTKYTVLNWMAGRREPSFGMMEKIAFTLDVDLNYFSEFFSEKL